MKKKLILIFISIIVSCNLVANSVQDFQAAVDGIRTEISTLGLNDLDFSMADTEGKKQELANADQTINNLMHSINSMLVALKAAENLPTDEKDQLTREAQKVLQEFVFSVNAFDADFKENLKNAMRFPFFDTLEAVKKDHPALENIVQNIYDIITDKEKNGAVQAVQMSEPELIEKLTHLDQSLITLQRNLAG